MQLGKKSTEKKEDAADGKVAQEWGQDAFKLRNSEFYGCFLNAFDMKTAQPISNSNNSVSILPADKDLVINYITSLPTNQTDSRRSFTFTENGPSITVTREQYLATLSYKDAILLEQRKQRSGTL